MTRKTSETTFCLTDPFVGVHLFETSAFLLDSIKLHYTEVSQVSELKHHAVELFF